MILDRDDLSKAEAKETYSSSDKEANIKMSDRKLLSCFLIK